jgi:hypothetical protein
MLDLSHKNFNIEAQVIWEHRAIYLLQKPTVKSKKPSMIKQKQKEVMITGSFIDGTVHSCWAMLVLWSPSFVSQGFLWCGHCSLMHFCHKANLIGSEIFVTSSYIHRTLLLPSPSSLLSSPSFFSTTFWVCTMLSDDPHPLVPVGKLMKC